jgi:S-adenosylmethionine:tRNA ribosyltransferase-isomerase
MNARQYEQTVGKALPPHRSQQGKEETILDFDLPPALEASEPPEARGLARDDVRLLVSYREGNRIEHAHFRDIGRFLTAGDLLVINTSGTMNAALPARRRDGTQLELHLSTHLPDGLWSVELRQRQSVTGGHHLLPGGVGQTIPFLTAQAGETLFLPDGASVLLYSPYASGNLTGKVRIWRAAVQLPGELPDYLEKHGFPIRYGYVPRQWPLSYYQTVFANEMGSAEMPSAGRAFTPELVTKLVSQGIQFAPLLLHTGVASLEDHEPPYAEYYRVSEETAQAVNRAHKAGKRVIAVGTTVVRALETVTDAMGRAHAGQGWTEIIIMPQRRGRGYRGIRAVNGLLTGLHEPRATHLAMLEALTDRQHLRAVYEESLRERYLWHEFGDLHLILPSLT